jgi:IclR family mhp operon transcriptional activator
MMVRATTDHLSPLALERYSAGFREPLLASASGRVYLAFCPAAQRETLVDILARSTKEEDKLARAPRADLSRLLNDIKAQGHATTSRTRRLVEEIGLSVPVLLEERLLACLTLRFGAAAVPLKTGVERFLPKLRQCAVRISNSFLSEQLSVGVAATP